MAVAIDVTFLAMWPSDEIMALVRNLVGELQATIGGLTKCHIELDGPQRKRGKKNQHRASLMVEVEGQESPMIVEGAAHRASEAVSTAFKSLGHQLRATPAVGYQAA